MNDWIDLHALWQILVIGLIAGAGLPALFAVGLRGLSMGTAGSPTHDGPAAVASSAKPLGMAIAAFCFAVVLAAIGWGIYFIVAGT